MSHLKKLIVLIGLFLLFLTSCSFNGIPAEIENSIKNIYYGMLIDEETESAKKSDIKITQYYGNYNGAHVYSIKCKYFDTVTYDGVNSIGGVAFNLHFRQLPEVFYQDRIYGLNEAYFEKVLTTEDLEKIALKFNAES